MRTGTFKWLGLGLFMLGLATPGYAIGLLQALNLAEQHDPKLRYAAHRLQATQEDLTMARAGYYPKVQLSLSQGRGETDAETGFVQSSGRRSYQTKNNSLTLKQPLLNLMLTPQTNIAKESISVGELTLNAERLNLFSRVAEKYFEVLYANESAHSLQQKLNAYQMQKLQADKRFEAGVGIKNDVMEIDAEIALVEAQLIEAQMRQQSTQKGFELLLGIKTDALNVLDDNKLAGLNLEQRSLDEWLEAGLRNNPDIEIANHEIAISQYKYQKDKYQDYPTVDLVVSRAMTESDSNITIGSKFDTTAAIVQLNVPLFTGGYASAIEKQSAILIDAAKDNQEVKQLTLFDNITNTHHQFQQSQHLIEAYRAAAKSYARSLNGAQQAFLAGTRTQAELIKIRDKLEDTQLNMRKSCYSLLLNYLQLKELTGEVSMQDMQMVDQLLVAVTPTHLEADTTALNPAQ